MDNGSDKAKHDAIEAYRTLIRLYKSKKDDRTLTDAELKSLLEIANRLKPLLKECGALD